MTIQTPRGIISLKEDADPNRLAKALKSINYLGPWCSRCGKKGPNCKNEKDCRTRAIKNATKGLDLKNMRGCTLPPPPKAWRDSKRGRYFKDSNEAKIEYAYDVAVGKWKPE